MKTVFILFGLLLSAPAWAGPWVSLDPVVLSAHGGEATVEIGEKLGKIDNIRFQLNGATVEFTKFTAIPLKGDPIVLKAPGILKSGEGSGLINIPGNAVVLDSLKLDYRVVSGTSGSVAIRLKAD